MKVLSSRRVGWIGVLVLVLSGGFAHRATAAQSEREMREAIDTILSMRHPVDTPDWWRKLGGDEPQKLVGVIISSYEASTNTYHRLRLVQSLAWFDDPAAVDFLKKQARTAGQDDVVRDAAVRSVGASQGAKERDFVASFLTSADADTRFAAAQSLKAMSEQGKDAGSAKILEKYLAGEKTGWIKPKLNGELPVPTARLGRVSSGDDQPGPLLEGVWRGFLVTAKSQKTNGMDSEAATLNARIKKETRSVSVELTLLAGGKSRSYQLVNLIRRGWRVEGELQGEPQAGHPAAIPFQGEVQESGTERQLELKIPPLGATLLVRHDP